MYVYLCVYISHVCLFECDHMKVQKVYLLQQSQILGNPTQCLLRHSQTYKKCKRHMYVLCMCCVCVCD